MTTRAFWVRLGERAVKTAAQSAAALLTADGLGLLAVDWPQVGSIAGMAAVVSVLTSLGSAPFGPGDSPSVVS
ncbi:MAG TPA: holin [Jiangellales bacterium]|nr:holin [Jiangellales bacterium]